MDNQFYILFFFTEFDLQVQVWLLSQERLSQSGLSQGLGLSQGDLSQDSVLIQPDLHSQLDNLLSQDSTYQGDRYASQNQFLSQFSQVDRL